MKAVVIRSPDYIDKDEDELIKELQDHVKAHTAPYKYPRKVRNIGLFTCSSIVVIRNDKTVKR